MVIACMVNTSKRIINYSFCHQCGIAAHAYNILVIVVVWNAVYIHRERKCLIFCNR